MLLIDSANLRHLCREQGGVEQLLPDRVASWDSKVIGWVVVRAAFAIKFDTVIPPGCHIVNDFWMQTKYQEFPLVYLQVVQRGWSPEPLAVQSLGEQMSRAARKWFFRVTPHSQQRLAASTQMTVSASDNLAAFMPTCHALAILTGLWTHYGYPRVSKGRGRHNWWHGMELLSSLPDTPDIRDKREIPDESGSGMFDSSPAMLQSTADMLRSLVNPLSRLEPEQREAIGDRILALEKTRSTLLLQHSLLTQSSFKMQHMLQCVLLSGMLRSAEHMKLVLKQALQIVVPILV